jgi:hypothetical protein
MIEAIRQCRVRSPIKHTVDGCGSKLRMAKGGWGVAVACKNDWHVAVEQTLAGAQLAMQTWQRRIRARYGVDFNRCLRVEIGPDGRALNERQAPEIADESEDAATRDPDSVTDAL